MRFHLHLLFAISLLTLAQTEALAQSLARQTISAFGASSTLNSVVIQHVAGQPSPTTYRQGFIQPFNKTNRNEVLLQFYPNPTKTYSRIEQITQSVSYQILDISGSKIQFGEIHPTNPIVETADLPAGLYILIVDIPRSKPLKFSKIN